MSLKNQKTKAEFMEWSEFQLLIHKLERDNEIKFMLLIALGVYTGLRISDLLQLKWKQVQEPQLSIKEKKTGKERTIQIHSDLKEIIERHHKGQKGFVFINRFGTKPMGSQYINRRLKQIRDKYELGIENISTHTFRKTLGRRVWSKNNYSEKALIMLSELFRHSNVSVTKIYLGIKDKEIQDIYLNL